MSNILIKKFHENTFGDLTTLVSEKTGKIMFIAKEVAELWGHTNYRKAIKDANLNEDEVLTIAKKQHHAFFEQLCNQQLQANKSSSITLISESGLYKMAFKSQKPNAIAMKDWIANSVLPSIRKTGGYTLGTAMQDIGNHKDISVQKKNSKDVNNSNYQNGGVPAVIEYNRQSCLLHTGKRPSEIKEFGKSIGLKAVQRQSAKEVLRNTNPAMACAMSLTDQMVKQGHRLESFVEISKKHALPLFKAMLEMGAIPAELNY